MPIHYDKESGMHIVYLDGLLSIEQAVALILHSKSPGLWDEFATYENNRMGLQDFLQSLYNNGHETLAAEGLLFYTALLDDLEKGLLHLHYGQIRGPSLITWLKSRVVEFDHDALDKDEVSVLVSRTGKQKQQEDKILDELLKLGYDRFKLPPNESGKKGVRAKISARLNGKGLFTGNRVFTKAWDRLLERKRIKYQT